MDCSPPGSSIHGILQARILEWVAFPSPGDLPDPGIEPRSPALQGDALPSEPPGKFIKGEAAKSMAGKGEPQLALASGGWPLARLRKQGSWNASGGGPLGLARRLEGPPYCLPCFTRGQLGCCELSVGLSLRTLLLQFRPLL